MKNRHGFTLLEVLIVVVIAVSITAFAVPAYKKTQERNKFLAAKGVLQDLGNGVRTLRADFIAEGMDVNDAPKNTIMLIAAYNSTGTTFENIKNISSISELFTVTLPTGHEGMSNDSRVGYALVARDYLQPIPYDSTNQYKGYLFYICPADGTGNRCCKANSSENRIACMAKSENCNASNTTYYPGAYIKQDGSVEEVAPNTATATALCSLS